MISENLKFMFLAPNRYPPNRVDVSVLFCEEFVKRGHSIDFILQAADDVPTFQILTLEGGLSRVFLGATHNGHSFIHRLLKRLYDFVNDMRMFPLILRNEYHFVQVRDKFVCAVFALIAAKIFQKPFFYWMSFPLPEEDLEKFKIGTARYPLVYFIRGHLSKFLLHRILLPASDHVFVQSEQMKKDLLVVGLKAENMTAIPMGISPAMVPDGISYEDVDPNCVAYLGSMSKVRRMDFVLYLFKKVILARPDARLLMIGGGDQPEDIEDLKRLTEEIGIAKHVIFTGFLPMKKALEMVKQALVCLSPFYPTPILNSTSPTKLVEYMAYGRAVVANDHPEQKLVLEKSGGGVCVSYEQKAFADAVLMLLSNPDLACSMGRKGYEYVLKNRTYPSIADKVEKTYATLCFSGNDAVNCSKN